MSHRLDAAIAARSDNDAPVHTFDALITEVLLDRSGTRHLILCLSLNCILSHQCQNVGKILGRALDTALCSQSMTQTQNPENEPGNLSSLTGRRIRETKVETWSFEVSPELEAWMTKLFRCALESDQERLEDLKNLEELEGRATVCRVTVSPEPHGDDFCVTCKTYTRATPRTIFVVAKEKTRALQCLWNFYRQIHTPDAEDYVKHMSEATAAFGPDARDAVANLLPKIYAEYSEILSR